MEVEYLTDINKNLYGYNGEGWYFWNEVYTDCYGPYVTKQQAETELEKFLLSIE